MRSSNPVLNNLPKSVEGNYSSYSNQSGYPGQNYQGYQAYQGYDAQQANQPRPNTDRPMTIDDVVTKTGITLAVIVVMAALNFGVALTGNVGLTVLLSIAGGIGAFITVLVLAFMRNGYSSAVGTLIYATLEGLFLGGFSVLMSGMLIGGANAGALIGQAILGTLGVFMGMLIVYKTGAIRMTPKLSRFITAAIMGVAILAVGNLLMAVFFNVNPLRDGGTLAIIFSLVCIVLAALSFLQDFDAADSLIRQGAPSKMAWGVALGLAVTLVWLYTEILRLLSYFQNR